MYRPLLLLFAILTAVMPNKVFAWHDGPRVHRVTGALVGIDPIDPNRLIVVAIGREPSLIGHGCDTPELLELSTENQGYLQLEFEHNCPKNQIKSSAYWPIRACGLFQRPSSHQPKLVIQGESNSITLEKLPQSLGEATFVTLDGHGRQVTQDVSFEELEALVRKGDESIRGGWPVCLERVALQRKKLDKNMHDTPEAMRSP